MEKQYFIHDGAQQKGPFTIDEIKALALKSNTMVWCEGMPDWKAAKEIPELSSLIASPPPPMASQNTQPPALNTQPVVKKYKPVLLYMFMGLTALFLITSIIFLIAAIKNTSSSGAESTEFLKAKIDSLQGVLQGGIQDNLEVKDDKDNKTNTPSISDSDEEAQKQTYRNNWKRYIKAYAHYASGPAGGITNGTITLSNQTPYTLDQVTVWANIIRVDGTTYRSEKIVFYSVGPHRSTTKNIPWSDKGTNVQTRLSKISSKAFDFYYSDI